MKRVAALGCALLLAALAPAAEWTQVVPSPQVDLRDPVDLSINAEGVLYIADAGHHRIVAVDSTGRLVAETGGFGNAGGQFQWPRAVVANRGNAIWVLDYGNRRIEKFTRSLEYQGTLLVQAADGESRSQPEAMALSPQGDLFVFDRDGGRLLRYDPLFNPQAELGRAGGDRFISSVAAMTFVTGRGLFWWSRGGSTIEQADALLNPQAPLRLTESVDDLRLAAADTCLVYGTAKGVFRQCEASIPPEALVTAEELAAHGVTRLAALAVANNGLLYLLDGGTDAVYRIRLTGE